MHCAFIIGAKRASLHLIGTPLLHIFPSTKYIDFHHKASGARPTPHNERKSTEANTGLLSFSCHLDACKNTEPMTFGGYQRSRHRNSQNGISQEVTVSSTTFTLTSSDKPVRWMEVGWQMGGSLLIFFFKVGTKPTVLEQKLTWEGIT